MHTTTPIKSRNRTTITIPPVDPTKIALGHRPAAMLGVTGLDARGGCGLVESGCERRWEMNCRVVRRELNRSYCQQLRCRHTQAGLASPLPCGASLQGKQNMAFGDIVHTYKNAILSVLCIA